MEGWTESILAFIRTHEDWAVPIVLVLAFGESLAFLSLLLPATVILFAVGGLVGASGIGFWPQACAAAAGARRAVTASHRRRRQGSTGAVGRVAQRGGSAGRLGRGAGHGRRCS